MYVIVGLGNPGTRYAGSRHNVGFMVADLLAREHGMSFGQKRFGGEVARGQIEGKPVLLLKPLTYMNRSGNAVGPAAGYFGVPAERVVVVHDDLDLETGRVKLKRDGGHGGHNGLRSIIAGMGTRDFLRVRVGIGRPPANYDPADYVLSSFSRAERPLIEEALEVAAGAVSTIIGSGMEAAMNQFNRGSGRGETPP